MEENPKPAKWTLALSQALTLEEIDAIQARVKKIASVSQYGWGNTIDFGPFIKEGLLKDTFLKVAGAWDAWQMVA